jgi:RHS repeat-associated protein
MTSKGSLKYSYDAENRLTKVEDTASSENLTYNLQLSPGWNFFSLPVIPASLKISTVLLSISGKYDQVSRYNSTSKQFEHYVANAKFDQFDSFEYSRGYQIYITDPAGATLTLTGKLPPGQTVQLKSQWNLIGANHKDQEVPDALKDVAFTRLARYNKATQGFEEYPSSFSKVEVGQAYYLKTNQDQSWNVNTTAKPTTEFVYDGDGGRVRKVVSNQSSVVSETTYIGSLYEVEADGTAKKYIFAGSNRICALTTNDQQLATHYYHGDHLGSSNVITDNTGQQVCLTEFTPYGSTFKQTGSFDPKHKFTGKELDASTNLYFYGARYYDHELGRFITADHTIQHPYDPQDLNRYAYCRNNPINLTDPTGLGWWKDLWKGIANAFKAIESQYPIILEHLLQV